MRAERRGRPLCILESKQVGGHLVNIRFNKIYAIVRPLRCVLFLYQLTIPSSSSDFNFLVELLTITVASILFVAIQIISNLTIPVIPFKFINSISTPMYYFNIYSSFLFTFVLSKVITILFLLDF